MEAKLIEGRVVLSETPTVDGEIIAVHFGDSEVKRLEVRAGIQSYDLPEGVAPESVTDIFVGVQASETTNEQADETDEVPANEGGSEVSTTTEEKTGEEEVV